jgi:uncharacterized protein YmfQ (DUF2313 family)
MDDLAYARQLKALLPPGSLWRLDPASTLSRALQAAAGELARIDERGENLLLEADPRTAEETLDDWESFLGLPEEGQTLGTSIQQRQADITRKFIAQGGSTPAYFIALAAALGYTATIDYPAANTWRMNVTLSGESATLLEFRMGSRIGDRLGGRTVVELERVINKLKPAHTAVLFLYT